MLSCALLTPTDYETWCLYCPVNTQTPLLTYSFPLLLVICPSFPVLLSELHFAPLTLPTCQPTALVPIVLDNLANRAYCCYGTLHHRLPTPHHQHSPSHSSYRP